MSDLSLTVLDVGHGSCAVLGDGSNYVMFDAGPGTGVLEYLREQGISHLDKLFISHADADHIRGVIAILGSGVVTIDNIWLNSDAEKASQLWSSLAYSLDDAQRRGTLTCHVALTEGMEFAGPRDDVVITVVAPRTRLAMTGPGAKDQDGRSITSNSISAVMTITVAGRRAALLTGDLDETGLTHLLDAGPDLAADVLVFPHHGGTAGRGTSGLGEFTSSLVAKVSPRIVLFSLGRASRYGTPQPDVITALRTALPKARIACTQLSKRCADEVPDAPVEHLLPIFASGRDDRSCCAGTIKIDLAEPLEMSPGEAHQGFIDEFAPMALCRV